MGLFRKRFYEAAEAHQRAERKQRRRALRGASQLGDEQRRRELRAASRTGYIILLIVAFLTSWGPWGIFWAWAGSYALGYAIALMQPAGAPFPMLSVWIIVAGNAPLVLVLLLGVTSRIWARNLPLAEEEE